MNVYNYIDMNYLHESELDNLLPQNLITDFLQKQAWTGLSDADLQVIWRDIYAYLLANLQTGQIVFQNRTIVDVKHIVAWLEHYALDFELTPNSLRRFLDNVQILHNYLVKEKYILKTYVNFSNSYTKFIYKDGNIKISSSDNKVLHIDFAGKRLRQEETFQPQSVVATKQLIYIREHIMDLPAKLFESLNYYEYTLTMDKLFSCYEIYWEKFVEAKLGDVEAELDADIIEQLVITNPNNILTFMEYIVFGATFSKGKEHVINRLMRQNKSNTAFVTFLRHYRGSRIMFFNILDSANENGTMVKDVLTGSCFCLEDIDIAAYGEKEVFIAYFNKKNKLLPSATVSIELDKMQILGFQDVVNKMCRYMLGEEASVNMFLEKYDMLARYLCVASVQNKRIGVILKKLIQEKNVEEISLYSEGMDRMFCDKFFKAASRLYFTNGEQEKLLQIWRKLYTSLVDESDFGENIDMYMLASLKIFLDLNYPDDISKEIIEGLEVDKRVLRKYVNKVGKAIELKNNKTSYLTEIGMIKLIDSLIDKE